MVMTMKKMQILPLVAVFLLAACGNDAAEPVAAQVDEPTTLAMPDKLADTSADGFDGTVSKVGSPFSISYRIIGTPVVGSPLAIELRITSALESNLLQLSYTVPDDTSMMLHEAQPAAIDVEFATNENWVDQRITVVPQREGRIYVNVAAAVDGADGRTMTMMAVPIQVGQGGRELEEQGEVATDENDEAIRILTND